MTNTATFVLLTQDTAQAHTNPPIQIAENIAVAVLEILKPTYKALVYILNSSFQTPAIGTLGLAADSVFKFL